MKNPRWLSVFAALLASGAACSSWAGSANPATGDWPQWRGPSRDGVAASSPKLLDAWPTNGPALLWESDPIGSGVNGGCGSVVVAEGKAFAFVHSRRPKEKGAKVVLTAKDLTDLGWRDDLPDDLAKKIEDARRAERVTYLNSRGKSKVRFLKGEELDAHIQKFIAGLEPAIAEKHGAYIAMRLKLGPETGVDWASLAKLAAVRGKEFPSVQALDQQTGVGLYNWHDAFAGKGNLRDMLCARVYDYPDIVICLDAATGKELWRRDFPDGLIPESRWREVGASGTPAVVDGKCFVAGSAGVYCLAAKDGSVVWKMPMKMFGGSSPLVVKDVVYQNTSDGLFALNAGTGQLLWKQPEVKTYGSSVMLWAHAGTNYLLSGGENLACVEPDKGAVLWRAGGEFDSTPVVAGDTAVVYYGSGLASYALTLQGATERWRTKGVAGDAASPVIAGEHAYICGGGEMGPDAIWCVSLVTGEVTWTRPVASACLTSPVLADGRIIAYFDRFNKGGGAQSRIVMFRAVPDKFEEMGQFSRPGDQPWFCDFSSPAVAGGRLYLRLANSIACYDLAAK